MKIYKMPRRTVNASTQSIDRIERITDPSAHSLVDEIFERVRFADSIIDQLEFKFHVNISESAYNNIMDLANDFTFSSTQNESDSMSMLETEIYNIFEEDTGICL